MFQDLRAVAIVSVKYKVQEIIDEVLSRLSKYFPSRSLAQWDKIAWRGGAMVRSSFNPQLIHIVEEDVVAVIALARLLHAKHILPAAFHVLHSLSPTMLLDGVTYDGEVVRITDDDMQIFLSGRKKLLQANTRVMRTFLDFATTPELRPAKCVSPTHCQKAAELLSAAAIDDLLYAKATPCDSLRDWLDKMQGGRTDTKPCSACRKAMNKIIDERRQEAWKPLGVTWR